MHSAVRVEEEIRAIALDQIVESRVLPFTPRLEMTDRERWDRLVAADPHAAAVLRAAFLHLYETRCVTGGR